MMKLFPIWMLVLACGASACQRMYSSPNQKSRADREIHLAASHVKRMDSDSFDWFMYLVRQGYDLPAELTKTYTFIAHPFGRIRAEAYRECGQGISAFILRQSDEDSEFYYLMTTDGIQMIDQQVVGQSSPIQGKLPQQALEVFFKSDLDVSAKWVELETLGEEKHITSTEFSRYRILESGEIVEDQFGS
ncbi:hypothetical protein [Pontibacter sp. G13]|uniref:hypothetical protein n=1 Tax=Pontibacter sp. G13 TaxID=3074898 RepID=UPI002889428A|nr:hypothetical protein [Pontibacter sp. G13]WNJ17960.1 hypothetical protein RJD25_24155 [Pontibacter sp. G13]